MIKKIFENSHFLQIFCFVLAVLKICLFPISDRMSKNSNKKYRMAYCLVKEKNPALTCPNQRMNKVVVAVKCNVFTAVKFAITHRSLES